MKYSMKNLFAIMAVVFVVIAGLNASLVNKSETISSSGIEVEDDNKYISLSHENVGEEMEYEKSGYKGVLKKSIRPDYEEEGTLYYRYSANLKKQ